MDRLGALCPSLKGKVGRPFERKQYAHSREIRRQVPHDLAKNPPCPAIKGMGLILALAVERRPQSWSGVADQHHRAAAVRHAVIGAGMESAALDQAGGGNGPLDGL